MLQWLALAALAVMAGCISAADAQQHDPSKSFDLHDNNNYYPAGIWSNGTVMWVADNTDGVIYAYSLSGDRYDSIYSYQLGPLDFELTSDCGPGPSPTGIWSDGTTMWVANNLADKICAYDFSSGSPDASKVFGVLDHDCNSSPHPAGIWSDGTSTMWVVEVCEDATIYAYHLGNKTRYGSEDFTNLVDAGNDHPRGIWSDGTTMWVVDSEDDKVYAYRMSDKERDESKEFDIFAGPNFGIWLDDSVTTAWVGSIAELAIDAYKVPRQITRATYAPPPPPPIDTTPPYLVSVERTDNATTANRTITWDARFSEPVVVGAAVRTNHTSTANATILDMGTVRDAMVVDVPGRVTGGHISVDLDHPLTSGLVIELVAPDCTRFVVHNQTTTFLYKLRQYHDLGNLTGIEAAGQWTLEVSDHRQLLDGTLNNWSLVLESEAAVDGSRISYDVTWYVGGSGNYTLSLDGYDIRDRAGNHLVDEDPAVNEPYHVLGMVTQTCRME